MRNFLTGFGAALCAALCAFSGAAADNPPSRLEVLLAGSRDPNESLRRSSIKALAEIKDPRVTDALIELSADTNAEIRELALESMAAVVTPKCFDALVSALADSNDRTRMHAARGLAALKDPRSIEPLMELLGPHRYDTYSRGTDVAAIIIDFGDKAVAPVAKALQTRSALRASLIQILAAINTKAANAELAKAAAAQDWRMRLAVIEVAARPETRGNMEKIVAQGLKDPIASVRFAAIAALDRLSQQPSPPSEALQNAIVSALNDSNPSTRERAVQLVNRLDDAHALAPLARLLAEGNVNVRRQAVARLSNMTDEAAAAPLIKALDDSDASVSRAAALALARLNRPEAIPALKRAAMGEGESSDYQALDALRQMGPKAVAALLEIARAKIPASRRAARMLMDINDPAAVAGVSEAIKSGDPQTRRELIAAMGSSRQPSAISVLTDAIKDSDEGVRIAAVAALGNLRTRAAVGVLGTAMKDPNSRVRQQVVQTLANNQTSALADDIAIALADVADEPDKQIQMSAASVLARTDSAKVVPLLCRLIEKGILAGFASRDSFRVSIVEALGRPGDTRATGTLVGLLKDSPDAQVQYSAAYALGRTGGQGAGEALIAAMGKGDARVQEMCVVSLGKLREKRAAKPLQEMAAQEGGPMIRSIAIALARIDSKAAWKPFLTMLNQQGGDAAVLAKALEESGGSDVVEALIAMLGQPSLPAHMQVIYWLGQVGDARAIEPLQKLTALGRGSLAGNAAYSALEMIAREARTKPPRPSHARPRYSASRPASRPRPK
ncbi:MAG: HEAT repeat domain-containing protein [Planctomycetaceae bacterium]|nr:HEAT repeat domain-containing protein [Planctomycetaceae bacterium]